MDNILTEQINLHIRELLIDFARFCMKPTEEEREAIRTWAVTKGRPTPESMVTIWEELTKSKIDLKVAPEPESDIILVRQKGISSHADNNNIKLSKRLKDWIENTSLFHALQKDPLGTAIVSDQISIQGLKRRIDKAEDLPKEMIWEFYKNSPYYVEPKNNNNQNQLPDAD